MRSNHFDQDIEFYFETYSERLAMNQPSAKQLSTINQTEVNNQSNRSLIPNQANSSLKRFCWL